MFKPSKKIIDLTIDCQRTSHPSIKQQLHPEDSRHCDEHESIYNVHNHSMGTSMRSLSDEEIHIEYNEAQDRLGVRLERLWGTLARQCGIIAKKRTLVIMQGKL